MASELAGAVSSASKGVALLLTPKEARRLLRLLDDHLYFGWVGLQGEKVVATWEVDPILEELYRRLRRLLESFRG